jgi:transposase
LKKKGRLRVMRNKSEVMRGMYELGKSVSEISKEMGCNYSYVYGVIERMANRKGEVMRESVEKKGSVSEEIRGLYREGLSVGEIAKRLNRNYSWVWSVCEKERKSK